MAEVDRNLLEQEFPFIPLPFARPGVQNRGNIDELETFLFFFSFKLRFAHFLSTFPNLCLLFFSFERWFPFSDPSLHSVPNFRFTVTWYLSWQVQPNSKQCAHPLFLLTEKLTINFLTTCPNALTFLY